MKLITEKEKKKEEGKSVAAKPGGKRKSRSPSIEEESEYYDAVIFDATDFKGSQQDLKMMYQQFLINSLINYNRNRPRRTEPRAPRAPLSVRESW